MAALPGDPDRACAAALRRGLRATLIVALAATVSLPAADVAAGAAPAAASTSGAASRSVLRVGTSGDYPPFSEVSAIAGPGDDATDPLPSYRGFDLAVATAYARDRGLSLQIVAMRWDSLLDDLKAGKFDIAMSGITVRPERSVAGRFSYPVAETGAVAVTHPGAGISGIGDLNKRGRRIAVNAGGHLEMLARSHFPKAAIIALPDNDAALTAALDRSVDAVVTDTVEAPIWQAADPQLIVTGPFSRDRKSYLARADEGELIADIDRWLLGAEADGSITRLRTFWFGGSSIMPTATALKAMIAAIDERLALMPLVAQAKAAGGVAVEAPAQEQRVIDAGLAAANRAAEAGGLRPPAPEPLRALFRSLIAAAKDLQREQSPAADAAAFDLDTELRPALRRITEKIAAAAANWEAPVSKEDATRALRFHLLTPGLGSKALDELAAALAALPAAAKAAGAQSQDSPATAP